MFNAERSPEYLDTEIIDCYAYPKAGHHIELWERTVPGAVGFSANVIAEVDACVKANPDGGKRVSPRWALWRNGYLIHAEGEFHDPIDVKSLRKTWHAMILGASIQSGRIDDYDQLISEWQTELVGNHRLASWRHIITQSAGRWRRRSLIL